MAATLNVVPLLLASPGGDIFFHYALIDCFSHQFWQGDLYPRWCIEANAGLGSPAFLFYYPLPYYLAAFAYPALKLFGLGVESVTLFSFWLSSVVAFLTAWLWLKDVITPRRALLGALAYIFMPYRMKLMLFNSALAELWCLTWTPLLFLYTRRLVAGEHASWPKLALVIAASLITHISATVFALLGCGVQALCQASGGRRASILALAGAGVLAIAATAVYWVPAMYLQPFLNAEALAESHQVPINRYMTIEDIVHYGGHAYSAVTLVLTFLMAAALGVAAIRHRDALPVAVRREAMAWLILAVAGIVLCSFLSAPLWQRFDYVRMGILPWRAQALVMYGAVYLLAVKMQWLVSPRQQKTWKGDYVALIGFMGLLAVMFLMERVPMEESLYRRIERAQIVTAREYRPPATDAVEF
ncbi:MAG: hypothetical protein KGJ06_06495, partial [Pseudomonadota bacterium]|nr:hypothetical protein [Pseudomonadota bacterium]